MEDQKQKCSLYNNRFMDIVILVFAVVLGFNSAIVGISYALDDTRVFLYVLIAYTVLGIVFAFLRTHRTKPTKYVLIALILMLFVEIVTAITLHITLFMLLGAYGSTLGFVVSIVCIINLFRSTPEGNKNTPDIVIRVIVSVLLLTFMPIALLGNLLIYNGGYHEAFADWQGKIIKDVSYGPDPIRNTMNFYIPRDLNLEADNEAIFIIHGGSWTKGKKEQISNEAKRVAKRGYIGITINYSFLKFQKVTVEDVLDEIDVALLKVKEFSDNKKWNIKRIGISGFSAGAHLAMMYSYTRAENSPFPICFTVSKNGPAVFTHEHWKFKDLVTLAAIGTGVDVVVPLQKIEGEDEKIKFIESCTASVSPHAHISSSSPPTLFSFSEKDTVVPAAQSKDLIEVFEKNKVKYKYFVYENSTHLAFRERKQHEGFYDEYFKFAKEHFKRVELLNKAA